MASLPLAVLPHLAAGEALLEHGGDDPAELLRALLLRYWQVLGDPGSVSRVEAVIVWNVRLPYALMAVVVGLALGLAAAILLI